MASKTSRISQLAAKISDLTAKLDHYHEENNALSPSFDEAYWQDTTYPADIEHVRQVLADATRELDELVTGPRQMVQNKAFPRQNYINVIYNFDIPNKVPKDGSISYTDLAKDIGVSEKPLRHLLRYAITNRIFKEQDRGFISHSAASRALAEDSALRDFLGVVMLGIGPASDYHSDALKKWPQATEPTEVAVTFLKDVTEPTYFQHVASRPDAARTFAGSMSLYTTDPGYSLHFLADFFPWGELGAGTVVDLGGSVGDTAFALANRFPDLNIVVQDLPHSVAVAKERPGINVKFMTHSFFEEQPVKGADVYMYRWCLHNHPDKQCVQALRALIPALKHGARVLIMEAVVPPVGTVPNIEERALRGMDCGMLSIFNAMEREEDEWREMFAAADSRFVWKGVTQPKGSILALIEAVWEPGHLQNGDAH